MTQEAAQPAGDLIDHILTHHHAGHRQTLPGLLAMAAAAEARGLAPGTTASLRALGDALELHMFKEEMRLFPMMEQGGNSLIAHLMTDLQREHAAHGATMHNLCAVLDGLASQAGADPAVVQLAMAVDSLADDLAQHIRAEDERLFPMFRPPHAT